MSHRMIRNPTPHVLKAARAYASGNCLVAGGEIDKAYIGFGRCGRLAGPLWRRPKALDGRFERACVRKHPRRARR